MKSRKLTICAFVFAFLFIVVGIKDGQQLDVLNKAIRICLECVGIG